MKQSFAIAAVAGLAAAAPASSHHNNRPNGKLGNDPMFLEYASRYNKDIRNPATFTLKQQNYHASESKIQSQNRKADESGDPNALRLAHNFTSDMSTDEYLSLLGLDQAAAQAKAVSVPAHSHHHNGHRSTGLRHGRHLEDAATNVDHFKDGFMQPVKDQGNCGSCWAFAANTAMEGAYAKKTNSAPMHFSEQQLVDCTLTTDPYNEELFGKDYGIWGCDGGWMDLAWKFQYDQGIMLEADYPYTSGNTSTETQCKHDWNKTVGKASAWGQVTQSVDAIKAKLEEQPLSVALDASSAAFQLYSSGVVTANDGCGGQLNHAVVMVGYTQGGSDGNDNDDNDDNDDDEWEPEPDDDEEDDWEPSPDGCKVTKWWHSCPQSNGRRRLQDASGNDNYWKIQNSWGTWWGDEGFIRIEIAEGYGVCGINSVVEWVDFEAN